MGHVEPAPSAGKRSVDFDDEDDSSFLDDAREWAAGRSWQIRLPLVLYLGYGFIRHLLNPLYGTFLFSGVTLGVHELGHVIFRFAGHFIMSAGGSFTQVAAPLILAWMFYRQPDFFAITVAGSWLSFSLFNLATYVGDARAMDLPLVGLSDDPEHDWHYLLGATHLLALDTTFAFLIRVCAFAIGVASLAFAVWLLRQMQQQPHGPPRFE